MQFHWFIFNFFILTLIISGVIIFILHRTLINSTEGAVKRLNEEIAKANEKQVELSRRIKEADEELAKRRAEADALAQKMISQAEEASKAERDKIIQKARQEGEEIIAKAQGNKENLRQELEKEFEVRVIDHGMGILNNILSQKAKGALDEVLQNEFIENLKNIDMSRISPDINSVEVITLNPIDDKVKSKFNQIIKEKLKRDVSLSNTVNPKIGGGVILKFGSLALDGSIQNLIRENGVTIKEKVMGK